MFGYFFLWFSVFVSAFFLVLRTLTCNLFQVSRNPKERQKTCIFEIIIYERDDEYSDPYSTNPKGLLRPYIQRSIPGVFLLPRLHN